MKKILLLFIGLLILGLFYFQLKQNNNISPVVTSKNAFVSIVGKDFFYKGERFYPLMLNYLVGLQTNNENEFWACPSKSYSAVYDKYTTVNKDSCHLQLYADMFLIKEMGFNSIRIIGIGETEVIDKQTQEPFVNASLGNEQEIKVNLSNGNNYNAYFKAIEELLAIIDSAGLKAVLLTKMSPDSENTSFHLKKLAFHLKNNSTLIGYDFLNEPLYFDNVEREKKDVRLITKKWNSIVKTYAPYHLTTIGLEGIREVFEWDPNILDVDYVSLHPYEYEPEQVMNEIYWYSNYIKKPWIIGETGIPADNDSVKYQEQKIFAEKTLKQAFDCGASGYSWWQYKDVEWFRFHANFLGLVSLKGETKTKKGLLASGTVKPTSEAFKSFNSRNKKESCVCLNNYYNYSNGSGCRLRGRLIDEIGNPIEGGVVLAWNEWWSSSYHTISKKDGTFELLGTFPFYHWMASATEFSRERGELKPDTAKTINDNIPTINIGIINLKKLAN